MRKQHRKGSILVAIIVFIASMFKEMMKNV